YRKRKDAAFLTTCSVLMRTLKDESVPMVLRKTAWRLLNERYQRIKLNQAYRGQFGYRELLYGKPVF
ncbi:hypothetical protein ACFGUB_004628, partial [Citrobacter freundii]